MSVRVGTSWRGRQPGRRYWVSMPLHDLVALGILGSWIWPFLLTALLTWWCVWLDVELVLIPASGAWALWQVHEGRGAAQDIVMKNWRGRLFWLGLRTGRS
jgi:hypothetical protein